MPPCALAGTAEASVERAKAVPNRRCLSFIFAFSLLFRRFYAGLGPAVLAAGVRSSFARLVRKWPHPQLLLGDLPQPREAMRLHDQEEDDQRANDDVLQV